MISYASELGTEASSSERAASDLNLGAPPPFRLGLTMYKAQASLVLDFKYYSMCMSALPA